MNENNSNDLQTIITQVIEEMKYMDWIQQWQSNLINKMGWLR